MDLVELVINELMVTYLQFGVFRINCTGIGFGGSQITWCYTRFSGAGFHMFGDFDFLLVGECLKNASVKLAQNWMFASDAMSSTHVCCNSNGGKNNNSNEYFHFSTFLI